MNKEKKNNSILKIGVFFTCTLSFVLLILILSRSFLREMDIAFAEDPISALFQTSSFQIPLSFSLSGYGKSAFYYLLKQYLLDPVFLCFFISLFLSVICLVLFFRQILSENKEHQSKIRQIRSDKGHAKNESRSFRIRSRQERIEYENVLHQIKSSLATLSLRAELTDPGKNQEQMILEIDQCSSMIDAYLTTSVAYSMKAYHFSLGNLADLLHSANSRLNEKANQRNIQIRTELEPAWLFMDPVKMEEAFETILSNFIEYSQKDSTISVHSCHTTSHLTVRITGLPIARPSFKTARYASKRNGHYGIGTDLASEIIESHFGTISSTMKDKRYVLTIRFPVYTSEQKFDL